MKFEWRRTEDGEFTADFVDGDRRGQVSFSITHDPALMQWQMRGQIHGLTAAPVRIFQALYGTEDGVPDPQMLEGIWEYRVRLLSDQRPAKGKDHHGQDD